MDMSKYVILPNILFHSFFDLSFPSKSPPKFGSSPRTFFLHSASITIPSSLSLSTVANMSILPLA